MSRDGKPSRNRYKSSLVYTYEVNGRQYSGSRVNVGITFFSTIRALSKRVSLIYPVGSEVDVHYNPLNPGDSVIDPHSRLHYLLWLFAAGTLTLAWAIGTGRLD